MEFFPLRTSGQIEPIGYKRLIIDVFGLKSQMMHASHRLRPEYRVLAVFLGTMFALGGALTWLCWRILQLDRELESQRLQERLEQAADTISGALTSRLQEVDRWLPVALAGKTGSQPAGITILTISGHEVSVQPRDLLYFPYVSPGADSSETSFAAGERSEFQSHDPAAAADNFRALADSPNPGVRAGALLRLARNLRKLGRNSEALQAYGELARIKDVFIDEVPADLLALDAKASLLEGSGRQNESRAVASEIDTGLRNGGWPLKGSVWEFYRERLRRWMTVPPLTDAELESLAVSRAAEWACRMGPRPFEPKGRRILVRDHRPVLISWAASEDRIAVVLVAPNELLAQWTQFTRKEGLMAALADLDGTPLLGSLVPKARHAMRSPAAIGLPATLLVMPTDGSAPAPGYTTHRRLLWAGIVVLALILTAGTSFILHSMTRERAVARMQSEFVSAVSHEFRTPLTSIKQLSEMLVNDRFPAEANRRESYDLIFHASERLQRLVESLLDFGRMEAAAFRYHFDWMDVRALVEKIVAEFRQQSAQGHSIELAQAEDLPAIRGDADAMAVALWNLMDNAVKYSPQVPTVWIETGRDGDLLWIAVRDRGMGISAREIGKVFNRFFRGSAARGATIRGTGIGLSLARHVVQAHGGEIRLVSQPGSGTTATILLPVEKMI